MPRWQTSVSCPTLVLAMESRYSLQPRKLQLCLCCEPMRIPLNCWSPSASTSQVLRLQACVPWLSTFIFKLVRGLWAGEIVQWQRTSLAPGRPLVLSPLLSRLKNSLAGHGSIPETQEAGRGGFNKLGPHWLVCLNACPSGVALSGGVACWRKCHCGGELCACSSSAQWRRQSSLGCLWI